MTEKRTKEIKIRLTDSEHRKLLEMAQNERLAVFMREYCLSSDNEHFAMIAKKNRTKINRLTVAPALLRQLAGIGNNLNQISRHLNSAQKSGQSIDLARLALIMQGIERDLNEIKEAHTEGEK